MISFIDGGNCGPSNHTKSYLSPVNDHPKFWGSSSIGSDDVALFHMFAI